MNTSNGAWERTAIIFLAVFAVGVVTASMEEDPKPLQTQTTETIETSPPGDLGMLSR